MALSSKLIRQLAIAAGALLVGAVLGQVWRSSRPSRPSPAPSSSATIFSGAPDGGQIYNLKTDPRLQGVQLRQMDREIFAAIASGQLNQSHMDDVFPSQPYRVKLVGSIPEHWIGVVLIDLTRDGKWDERWDMKHDDVDRLVFRHPSADNFAGEPSDAKFSLRSGHWQGF